MAIPGGFGRLAFGLRAFGAGGPLTVVRAGAIASHVVRVVFNVEPTHRSPAGGSDALNPSNYVLIVPGGNAAAPVPVGVDRDPIVGPAYLVGNGSAPNERGIDVHVDRALVFGVIYNIRARNVLALAGGSLGSPDDADFGGVTRLEETKLPERNQDLIDISSPVGSGHWRVDDSGDLALATADEGSRTRYLRRLTTKLNAFKTLNGYGLKVDLKSLGSVAKLAELKSDGIRQLRMEPDAAAIALSISQSPIGLTTIALRARTRRSTFVDVNGTVSAVGQFVLQP